MSASKRSMEHVIYLEAQIYGVQRMNRAVVKSAIDAEYAPLIEAARQALTEMSWALHNKCVDAPGLFEQRRTKLRSALAHIEGGATP